MREDRRLTGGFVLQRVDEYRPDGVCWEKFLSLLPDSDTTCHGTHAAIAPMQRMMACPDFFKWWKNPLDAAHQASCSLRISDGQW